MKKNQDIYTGIGIIAFALLMATQLSKLSDMQSVYPKFLLVLMVFSGVCIIINAIVKQKKSGVVYKKINLQFLKNEVLLPGIYLIIMALLVKPLGLYVVAFLTIVGICLLEDYIGKRLKEINLKHILKILLASVLFTAVLYLLFHIVLKLPTPEGIFGF